MSSFLIYLMLISIYFAYISASKLSNLKTSSEFLSRLIGETKNWVPVVSTVQEISYGIEHFVDLHSSDYKTEVKQKKADLLLYGKTHCMYSFEINGKEYKNRMISIVAEDRNIEKIRRIKIGGKTKAYVDPENPDFSILIKQSDSVVTELFWKEAKKSMFVGLISIVFFICSFILYIADLGG